MGCTLELDADLLSELGEPLEDNRAGTGLPTDAYTMKQYGVATQKRLAATYKTDYRTT